MASFVISYPCHFVGLVSVVEIRTYYLVTFAVLFSPPLGLQKVIVDYFLLQIYDK